MREDYLLSVKKAIGMNEFMEAAYHVQTAYKHVIVYCRCILLVYLTSVVFAVAIKCCIGNGKFISASRERSLSTM